jgi:hypothetical protein
MYANAKQSIGVLVLKPYQQVHKGPRLPPLTQQRHIQEAFQTLANPSNSSHYHTLLAALFAPRLHLPLPNVTADA